VAFLEHFVQAVVDARMQFQAAVQHALAGGVARQHPRLAVVEGDTLGVAIAGEMFDVETGHGRGLPFAKALFASTVDKGESAGASGFPLSQRGIEGDFSKGCARASARKSPPAPL